MERAALNLAASAVSPIFSSLAGKAASYFGGDITEEEMHNLKCFVIPKIQAAIELAEGIHVDKLKPWLMALRAAAYEAEDVLDMYEYKRLQAQVSPLPTSIKTLSGKAKNLFAPITLKTKFKKSMEKLQKYAVEAEKLISIAGCINQAAPKQETVNQQRPPTVSTPSSQIFGRDQERNFLVDVLISAPNEEPPREPSRNTIRHVPVVAIHGIGGAGKTTLAQSVYNDPRVAHHFGNNRMWVHVSNHFDECKVTREIIESVTGDGKHNNINSLNVLQHKLKDVLKSKRFLLVLDDVWCDDKIKWDQMLIPLNETGNMGSTILITTRTQEVASKLGVDKSIPLNELQSGDYWSIFKHYAFGDANKHIDDPTLLEIAEEIVKKLCKSPLVARMVGSLLNRKMDLDSWKMILKQDMMKDASDALLLSFQHLPPHLQQCFSICSLYPKGHIFHPQRPFLEDKCLDDLIKLWIVQGFVEANNMSNVTVEEKGVQCFQELVAHSFFQKDLRGNYIIHDLLHDLSKKVSKDHCFRIEGDEPITIPSTIVHLSIATHKLSLHIPDILKLVNLRTFINFDKSDVDFNGVVIVKNNIFKKLTKLRVFDAGSYSMGSYPRLELHNSIGQLKHLRLLKLQLNKVRKMPESLCTLYHIQYLIFDGYGSIDIVSQGLHNLINLRCLDDRACGGKNVFSRIPLFGQLTSLQQLKVYHATRNKNCEIGQLKNLQQLRGSLGICDLENVKDKAEAMEASLKDKKHLDELKLEWGHGVEGNDRMDEQVLEGLEPPSNLKILEINRYQGVGFPRWMLNVDKFLSNLQSLDLSYCSKLCIVPPLGQLRLLTRLYIFSMPLVEVIGPDFYGRSDNGELGIRFPRLEVLEFRDMKNWVHWYGAADGVELFPRLQQLSINYCPNLLQVPYLPHTLKVVNISGCKKLSGMFSVPCSLEELHVEDCPGIESLMPCDDQQEEEQSQQQKNKSPNQQLFPCLLRKLSISFCSNLIQIPRLPLTLQELKISHCENLHGVCGPIPQGLRSLEVEYCPKLMQLSPFLYRVEEMKMEGWPAGVEDMQQQQVAKGKDTRKPFPSISKLILCGLPCLTSLVLGPNMPALEYLTIGECENLESIGGSSLASILSLKYLKICNCPRLMMQPDGEDDDNTLTSLLLLSPSLVHLLILQNCGDFNTNLWGKCLQGLTSLSELRLIDCSHLRTLPELSNLTSLTVHGCPQLTSLGNSQCLFELCVKRCPKLQIEGGGGSGDGTAACCHFPSLNHVITDDLYMLDALLRRNQGLSNSLIDLTICGQDIGFTPEQEKLLFHQLTSLRSLTFYDCQNLPSLPVTLNKLSSLELLQLWECPKIESLPNLPASLVQLSVYGCHEQLRVKYGKDGPLRKKIRHIPNIEIH